MHNQTREAPPPSTELPLWLRLVDGASVVLVLLIIWQVITGGARGGLLRFLVPPDASTAFLLYTAAALLILRHVARPTPSVFSRLRERLRGTFDDPVWGPAWRAFLSTRLAVFVVAFFAVATFGTAPHPGFQVTKEVLPNLPARYDAGWYAGIATSGYEWSGRFERQSNLVFFPAMPMLMRGVGEVLGARDRTVSRQQRGARLLWGGVLVSLVCFFFALIYLIRLAIPIMGESRAAAAASLIACYPFAYFYNAPYTEGLFLLSVVATVYHFNEGQPWRAALWGLLVGLTRPNGFFLAVPLGLIILQRLWTGWRGGNMRWKGELRLAGAAVAPVLGMLIFTVYLFAVTGVWFAWRWNQLAWGRTFDGLAPFQQLWTWLTTEGLVTVTTNLPFDGLNSLGVLFALAMVWPVYRRIGFAWSVYVLIMLLPPLLAGGMMSAGRMTATMFPIFLGLAAILPPRAVPQWCVPFAMLQALGAALFFTWRELF